MRFSIFCVDVQPHDKGAAFAGRADHIQVAFVLFDHLFGDCQSQTETLEELVTHVLVHEIGHHMGLSDAQIDAIEASAG